MATTPVMIRVACLDGAEHVIENAERLADAFFSLDRSSRGEDSYDAMAARTAPNRITREDIDAINGPMRARSKPENWENLIADRDLPWLTAVGTDWDLADVDEVWEQRRTSEAIRGALVGIIAPYRNVSVATKMLHLKRPALIPVLDRLVVAAVNGRISAGGSPATRASQSLAVIEHLRGQIQANLNELRQIQERLDALGVRRTTTRILDGLLWVTHPESELSPLADVIARWRKEDSE